MGGRDEGGVTPLPLFYLHYLLLPLHNFSHIFFLPSAPPPPSDITWLFSNDVTWGRRRFAIWRPGWLRRLRWQCVGSWRRDGRGLYWRRQRCDCQWGAGWHDGLQLEGGYRTHLSWIMLHACAVTAVRTVLQFWTTVTFEKGTPYLYGYMWWFCMEYRRYLEQMKPFSKNIFRFLEEPN